jgi:hypothetical protein
MSYNYKLYRVKRNGRTTTVSLDPSLVIRACKRFGVDEVDGLVKQAAQEFDGTEGESCSGYVAQQLQAALQNATPRTAAHKLPSVSA